MPGHCKDLIKEKQNLMALGADLCGIIIHVERSPGHDRSNGIFQLCGISDF